MAIARQIFPFLSWLKGYSQTHLKLDFLSGLTVALILIPQSMAYAHLAGLPAHYGLYASLIPPIIAALFGSCRQLSTGPVAVVSLITAIVLEPLATAGSEAFIGYAILLAFVVGLFQLLLGLLRLGLIVNFLSHPVVNGFTNAAAIIIGTSQFSKLFGISVDKAEHHYQTVYNTLQAAIEFTHWPTFLLGLLAFLIMFTIRHLFPKWPNVLIAVCVTILISWGIDFEKNHQSDLSRISSFEVEEKITGYNRLLKTITEKSDSRAEKSAMMRDVLAVDNEESIEAISLQSDIDIITIEIDRLRRQASLFRTDLRTYLFTAVSDSSGAIQFALHDNVSYEDRIWRLKIGDGPISLSQIPFIGGGAVVGNIPAGLPEFKTPKFDLGVITSLIPIAIIIALLGFMESISVARAIASRSGHRLDANQELIGQGLANIGGSFFQSYAVSGSFSRSAVNFQSGAFTGISNVIASLTVLLVLLFFTPLFYHLPQSVLAAIIINAVIGLFNFQGFIHAWRAQWYDGLIGIVTFIGTLYFAPHLDKGILLGIGLSIGWYLLRSMKPAVTFLAKHPDRTYHSQDRFGLDQCRHIALIRYDGALFFANINQLEEIIFTRIRKMPELKHIIIMANGINELDASGEETLSGLVTRVREAGIEISLTGLNNSVLDTMRRTGLYEKIGTDHLFRTVNLAIGHVWDKAHHESDEKLCPLAMHPFRKYPVAKSVKKDPRFLNGPDKK